MILKYQYSSQTDTKKSDLRRVYPEASGVTSDLVAKCGGFSSAWGGFGVCRYGLCFADAKVKMKTSGRYSAHRSAQAAGNQAKE